jgi:hypothetical protein
MLTVKEAEAQGFTVNRQAAGRPIGYKGRVFAPTAVVPILTELEERLLQFLGGLVSTQEGRLLIEGRDVTSGLAPIMSEVRR